MATISIFDDKYTYERWVRVEVLPDGKAVAHEPEMYEIHDHDGNVICTHPRKGRTFPEYVVWAASWGFLINRGADLRGIDLGGLDLRRANFTGCDLRGANLQYSHLAGAFLTGADLRGANLRGIRDLDAAFTTNTIF